MRGAAAMNQLFMGLDAHNALGVVNKTLEQLGHAPLTAPVSLPSLDDAAVDEDERAVIRSRATLEAQRNACASELIALKRERQDCPPALIRRMSEEVEAVEQRLRVIGAEADEVNRRVAVIRGRVEAFADSDRRARDRSIDTVERELREGFLELHRRVAMVNRALAALELVRVAWARR